MARIQQSIDISVPVHTAYHQLMRFEDYPRFMRDVEAVHRLDDTHLHWSTRMSDQPTEWDAEITEQQPDRCIAWRNISGPVNAGKIELQPIGPEKARITLTMKCEPSQVLAGQNGAEAAMAERIQQDLARFKKLIETCGPERGNPSAEPRADETMLSAASLSRTSDDQAKDGRFSVAEEQNLDQQSDQARRVGQMPQDIDAAGLSEVKPAEATAKSIKREKQDAKDGKDLA